MTITETSSPLRVTHNATMCLQVDANKAILRHNMTKPKARVRCVGACDCKLYAQPTGLPRSAEARLVRGGPSFE